VTLPSLRWMPFFLRSWPEILNPVSRATLSLRSSAELSRSSWIDFPPLSENIGDRSKRLNLFPPMSESMNWARFPISPLNMKQMPYDIERAPTIRSFRRLHPFVGRLAEPGLEHGRTCFKQCNRCVEIEIRRHPVSISIEIDPLSALDPCCPAARASCHRLSRNWVGHAPCPSASQPGQHHRVVGRRGFSPAWLLRSPPP
jgi:hypothetical protein